MLSLRCSKMQLRRWYGSGRIGTLLAILVILTYGVTKPMIQASMAVELPTSLWLFPHLFVDRYMIMCYMLCVLLLFCDAPFVDAQQIYVIARIGKRRWAGGMVLYICFASLILFLTIGLMTVIAFLPTLECSLSWGKLFEGLQLRNPYTGQINAKVIANFSPLGATMLVLFLTWQAGMFLGLLLFRCNLQCNRAIGLTVAGAFAFLDFLNGYMRGYNWMLYISPVSWVNLDLMGEPGYPPLWYGIVGFLLLNSLLAWSGIYRGSRLEPHVQEEN